MLFAGVSAAAPVVGWHLVGDAIDQGIRAGDETRVHRDVVLYIAVNAVAWALGTTTWVMLAGIGQRMVFELRRNLFEHLTSLSLRYFSEQKAGWIIARLTSDVDALSDVLNQGLTTLIVNSLTLVAAIAGLFVVAMGSSPAEADGLSIGYGDNCWNSGNDADGDSLNDDCEYQLAYWFSPKMWFDSGESGSARHAHWSVKSVSYSQRTVQVFYMNAYINDTGVLTGHDGDPEFQIFELFYSGGTWKMNRAYMSAHRKSACDSSAWYQYNQLVYDDTNTTYRGWPTIYVAEDKHATYNTLGNCDDGCWYQDYCSLYFWQYEHQVGTMSQKNVGQSWAKLINRVYYMGESEDLWDDEDFEGWDGNWYRSDSKGYRRHTNDFGF